jgi:hypothetical protein
MGLKTALTNVRQEVPPEDGNPDKRALAIGYLEPQISTKQAALVRACLDQVSRLILAQAPLLSATRVELEVPNDAAAIEAV